MTFEEFLQEAISKGGEVRLLPRHFSSDSPVTFYAHIKDRDGSSVDFEVRGNDLTPCTQPLVGGALGDTTQPEAA